MNRYLLIDGYNVMNTWSKQEGMEFLNLEEAREKLIQELVDYKCYTGEKVCIVFDAYLVKGNLGSKMDVEGVEVVYTKENQTADAYIEKKVEELLKDRRNRVRVATSDRLEQQMILGSGATRISARELVMELKTVRKEIIKKTEETKENKMALGDRIDERILETLEKWRKNP